MAKAAGGRLLLRIEDIDEARCRPEYEDGDLRGPRLARPRLGTAGAAAVRAFRRLSRRAAPSSTPWGWSIRASKAAPRSRGWSEREREALAARSRRRAALSGRREIHPGRRARAALEQRGTLRAAPRHGRGDGARRSLCLERDRRGPSRRNRRRRRRSRCLGRRDPGAQGCADQLSPRRRGRRRRAGRDRCGARAGSFPRDRVHRLLQACSACPRRAIATTG